MFRKSKEDSSNSKPYNAKKYFRKKMREEVYANENFPLGLAKGIIYSSGGVLIWVLIGFLGFITSIAAIAIGYLFYLGLKAENVVINNRRLTMIIIYTVIVSLLSSYIELSIDVMSQLDISFFDSMFIETPYNIANNSEFRSAFLTNMAMVLLFSSLAAYSVYRKIQSET